MHIPDGFLDLKTAGAGWALSTSGLGVALGRVRRTLPASRVPTVGLAAAFIFVAQMLNFPVIGGTSGHLVGAVLATVLLGLEAGIVVMTCVLVLQCLLFADGGLLALGANLFNMAILAPVVGHAVYRLVRAALPGLRGMLTATAFASWCSVVAAAVSCAGQLALSGTVAWRAAFPAMTAIHMLIGLGEAAITTMVVAAVMRTRPELLPVQDRAESNRIPRETIAYGLILAFGLALFVAPFASPWPDGLERVAANLGIAHRAVERSPALTIPGLVGVAIAFLFSWAVARAAVRD